MCKLLKKFKQINVIEYKTLSTSGLNSEFANGLGDLGSISGRVIPKTQKMVLDATLLNTQHYKERIKVKWSNPGKGVAPSPTPWCSSYRKRSLLVTPNYGRQQLLLLDWLPYQNTLLSTHSWASSWIHAFAKSISIKWNTISLISLKVERREFLKIQIESAENVKEWRLATTN